MLPVALVCLALLVPVVELGSRWMFQPLRRLAAAIANSWPLAWLNRRIARLPPYAALALMVLATSETVPDETVAEIAGTASVRSVTPRVRDTGTSGSS